MTHPVRSALLAATLMLSGGCASLEEAPGAEIIGMEISGLLIRNQSYATLSEVILLVVQTGEFIACGQIRMRSHCATTFPLRQYQGNDIEIRWKEGGRKWSTGKFVVEAQDGIDPDRPARVRVTITPAGTAVTELVQ